MNKSQRDYAVSCIRRESYKAQDSIVEKHGWPEVKLSLEKKWSLVKSGKAKLKKTSTTRSAYDKWMQIFDFSPFEKESGTSTKGKTLLKALEKDTQDTIDKIYLSGADEVLEAIKDFRKKYE